MVKIVSSPPLIPVPGMGLEVKIGIKKDGSAEPSYDANKSTCIKGQMLHPAPAL